MIVSVAETGSFRRGAVRLSLGQPALSRRIRRLEDALGVSIFERLPTGARLTEAGSRFAASSQVVVRDVEKAIFAAQGHGIAQKGRLRLGLIASLSRGVLRKLLAAYLAEHPGIQLLIEENDRSALLTLLSHREIDAVIAAGEPEPEFGDGLQLHREAIFLAIRSDHQLADRGSLSWPDLRDELFIVTAREAGPEIHVYIVRRGTILSQSIRVRRYEIGREGIMNLVGLGLGVSLVADHWLGVSYPNVTFVRIGDENESIPFSITWRPENDNPALRRFLSLARIEAKRNGSLSAPSQTPDPSP